MTNEQRKFVEIQKKLRAQYPCRCCAGARSFKHFRGRTRIITQCISCSGSGIDKELKTKAA